MISSRAAGIALTANMARLNGTCAHKRTEPVELLVTGELVARLCADCLVEVPLNWGCEDCAWIDVRTFVSVPGPRLIPGVPCPKHTWTLY